MEFLANLPLDQLPFEVNALTIGMAAIVILFFLISIVKGILKTIFTLIQLAVFAGGFIFGYIELTPYIEPVFPKVPQWLPFLVGGVCAIVAFTILQLIIGLFTKKSNSASSSGESSGGRKKKNLLSPIFGLIIGILALCVAMTALRYYGTPPELAYLQSYVTEGPEQIAKRPLIVQAKKWLDESSFAKWQEKFDFINTSNYRSRLNLAKLLIVSSDKSDLTLALLEKENHEVLKTPEIVAFTLTNNELREFCEKRQFRELYKNEQFLRLSSKPSTRRELLKLNLDSIFLENSEDTPEEE